MKDYRGKAPWHIIQNGLKNGSEILPVNVFRHVLKKSGTYKVLKENVNGTGPTRTIFDNNENAEAKYIGLNGNKFSLGSAIGSAADGEVDFYEKQ